MKFAAKSRYSRNIADNSGGGFKKRLRPFAQLQAAGNERSDTDVFGGAGAVCMTTHHYDLHNPDGPGNIKWAEAVIDGQTKYIATHGRSGSWAAPRGFEAIADGFGRTGDAFKRKELPSSIPYRTLPPVKTENLPVAGRCLSAEFMAQAGCRLVLTCLNMGQAAGTAAALSIPKNIVPRKVDHKELQSQLLKDGCELGQSYGLYPLA